MTSSVDEYSEYYTSDTDEPYVSTIQFGIQDMWHIYAPKYTKVHPLKTPIPTSQVCVHKALDKFSYSPIQELPPLCDDPRSPWFYINDCRPQYPQEPHLSLVPQLIIRSTPYYPLHNLTPNSQNVYDTAVNLANFYEDREDVYKITVILLAQLYMDALTRAREVQDTIIATTEAITQSKTHSALASDFGTPDREPAGVTKLRNRMNEQLIGRFVGLKPYVDQEIASFLKAPLYAIDWEEYDEFGIGGSLFDSYDLSDYEAVSGKAAQRIYADVYRDMFSLSADESDCSDSECHDNLEATTDASIFYRQAKNFSLNCFATLPHSDYIIVRPTLGTSPLHDEKDDPLPIIVKPMGRWVSTYELIIKLAESFMLRDPDFSNDFTHKKKQKFDSVKSKYANSVVDDSSGKCSVCRVEFDSYLEHVASKRHIQNYRKELNRLFRPSFLETEAEKRTGDGSGSGDAASILIAHKSPTYFEYVKHVSRHMEMKNATLAHLSCLANCIATREGVDYSLACDAVTRSCYSLGFPFMLDPCDKPVRASSPTIKRSTSLRGWMSRARNARATKFEDAKSGKVDTISQETYALDAQITYALSTMFEMFGPQPFGIVSDSFTELLAVQNRANRRHLTELFVSADNIRSAYSTGSAAQRMGLCNFASLFVSEKEGQSEVVGKRVDDDAADTFGADTDTGAGDTLQLSHSDVTALISELKDYEIGILKLDGILRKLSRFVKNALTRDVLFPVESVIKNNATPTAEEPDTELPEIESNQQTPSKMHHSLPDIRIPNIRRKIAIDGDSILNNNGEIGDTTVQCFIEELEKYPLDAYSGLISEVDKILDLDDSIDSEQPQPQPHILIDDFRSASFSGFYAREDDSDDVLRTNYADTLFSNSFDTGAGVTTDCYSMKLLAATSFTLPHCSRTDELSSACYGSRMSAVYSAIVPTQIGPQKYLNACLDVHNNAVDSLIAYNGASLVNTEASISVSLNATRIVRQSVQDIASTGSVTYIPESRTALRMTVFAD